MHFRCPVAFASLLFVFGCENSSKPIHTSSAFPAPPALGAPVDRVGRAAIVTALVSTFDDPMNRASIRDTYNAAPRNDWDRFSADIQGNLALYDGLDGQCGNQTLADASLNGPERYDKLAGVLTDDRLYVNTASNACNQYFGVELDVTSLAPNEDCGGRTPIQDTIDFSYTALVMNVVGFAIQDGVNRDNVIQSIEDFPFLAAFVPPPAPPALGVQVDRAGRSAITTALISPLADTDTRNADRETYNQAPRSEWPQFSTQIAQSLGAYDGLDGACGNQILADQAATGADRYSTFSSVLADDRLYLASNQGVCNQYLGVELQVTNLVPNLDCGGRTPLHDTIDVSYTGLTNNLSQGVTDGVAADDIAPSVTTFPFLAP